MFKASIIKCVCLFFFLFKNITFEIFRAFTTLTVKKEKEEKKKERLDSDHPVNDISCSINTTACLPNVEATAAESNFVYYITTIAYTFAGVVCKTSACSFFLLAHFFSAQWSTSYLADWQL